MGIFQRQPMAEPWGTARIVCSNPPIKNKQYDWSGIALATSESEAMSNMQLFFSRLRHSPTSRWDAVTLFMLIALGWSSLAFSREIHVAAKSGNMEKVKALLKKQS
jgi:hypothetical protein